MAMNRIQFQAGMSLFEFFRKQRTETQCEAARERARWVQGFRYPRRGSAAHCVLRVRARKTFQCNARYHQSSLTAGTRLEGTKLALTVWFLTMYLMSQAKTGLSALPLKRDLGGHLSTARLIHHKLMQDMVESEEGYVLYGTVQLDDAYLGGKLNDGTTGRGSENKVPLLANVSLDEHDHPPRAKLAQLPGFARKTVADWASAARSPRSTALSEGLACFAGATEAGGCPHLPTVVGGCKARELPLFLWVNSVLGNVKTVLRGAYHAFAFGKYAERYLSTINYRFNRRFDLHELPERLSIAAAAVAPFQALHSDG